MSLEITSMVPLAGGFMIVGEGRVREGRLRIEDRYATVPDADGLFTTWHHVERAAYLNGELVLPWQRAVALYHEATEGDDHGTDPAFRTDQAGPGAAP